jgi:hypothetical protein
MLGSLATRSPSGNRDGGTSGLVSATACQRSMTAGMSGLGASLQEFGIYG